MGAYPSILNEVDYHSWREKFEMNSRVFRKVSIQQIAMILSYLEVSDLLFARLVNKPFYDASMLAINENFSKFKKNLAEDHSPILESGGLLAGDPEPLFFPYLMFNT